MPIQFLPNRLPLPPSLSLPNSQTVPTSLRRHRLGRHFQILPLSPQGRITHTRQGRGFSPPLRLRPTGRYYHAPDGQYL